MAIKRFRADNHALSCIVVPVNSFSSAIFTDIVIHISETSYFGHWDNPGASYCYSAGIVGVSHCIMAESCIRTLLRDIF